MSSIVLVSCIVLSSAVASPTSGAEGLTWQSSKSHIALLRDSNVVWQFNYGPELNVPYFHPVATIDGQVLTCDQPADHAWHHGVWFSWKYINNVNYWEHAGRTGKPVGRTDWTVVRVTTNDDGSATIVLTLRYRPANESRVVLAEDRQIKVSAPDSDGSYVMDWTCKFTAGETVVKLDRTPPKEKSWGGYAGLSIRFAKELTDRQTHDTKGLVEFKVGNRHRERAVAMDYSGRIEHSLVGVALLDHVDNPRYPTRWYAIRDPVMSYINAALLNDEPLTLQRKEVMNLRYRVIVHPNRWRAEQLQAALREFAITHGSAE